MKKTIQLSFVARIHGGQRPRAGRKNRTGKRSHLKRPKLRASHPVHLTLRLVAGLPSLKKKKIFKMLNRAVLKARNKNLLINHFSILSNHIHIILEPKETILTSGVQSLAVSFAKQLNSYLERKGPVFFDRYHQVILKTPTQVRRALSYVLLNLSKHRGERPTAYLGFLSSALLFKSWDKLGSEIKIVSLPSPSKAFDWLKQACDPPQTWLLTKGWLRGC